MHRLTALLPVTASLLALLVLAGPGSVARAADLTTSDYVVSMAPGSTDAELSAAGAAVGVKIKHRYHGAMAGFSTQMTAGQAAALAAQPGVAFVEPDIAVSAVGKPAPAPVGESVPPGIKRVGGLLGSLTRPASGVGVAIVDSGLDLTNPELPARDGVNCITATSRAQDDNGHGTSVGGVVAANVNGTATVGVAPGTPLYAVKVLNARASGTLSQLLCGLDWIAANAARYNIKVANMSISAKGADDGACGTANGEALHRAVCGLAAKGVLVVAAAGNAGVALETTVPAAYRETLAVTATADTDGAPGRLGTAPTCVKGELDDRAATFSNFATTAAAQAHTVAAPGVCILSTGLKSSTATYYGTSSAAPHAAAVAALCLDDAGTPGPCAALAPAGIIQRLATDAISGAAGFAGDPLAPISGRFYGPLVSAASY